MRRSLAAAFLQLILFPQNAHQLQFSCTLFEMRVSSNYSTFPSDPPLPSPHSGTIIIKPCNACAVVSYVMMQSTHRIVGTYVDVPWRLQGQFGVGVGALLERLKQLLVNSVLLLHLK